ncbi:MAG TPA: hypothetical protein VIM33_04930 [Gaiellaceae bacterium]|jgi:hypothetical protein
MKTIFNVNTQDVYAAALTLEDDQANLLAFTVANASAIARLRAGRRESGGDQSYGPELLLTPQSQPVPNVSGVKFRSAIAGVPAAIIATLAGPDDPQIGAGIPFAGKLAASGAVSSGAGVTGSVASNGSILAGTGFSVVRLSAGRYRIVFNTALPAVPLVFVAVTEANTANEDVSLNSVGATQFQVNINDAGVGVDRQFNFLAETIV